MGGSAQQHLAAGVKNPQMVHHHVGEELSKGGPRCAAIAAAKNSDICADKQIGGIERINHNRIRRRIRQVTGDVLPTRACVGGFEDVSPAAGEALRRGRRRDHPAVAGSAGRIHRHRANVVVVGIDAGSAIDPCARTASGVGGDPDVAPARAGAGESGIDHLRISARCRTAGSQCA